MPWGLIIKAKALALSTLIGIEILDRPLRNMIEDYGLI